MKGDAEGFNPAILSDALAGALQKKESCVVLDRGLIKKILDEKTLTMTGIAENDASKVGALIGADKIISGTVSKVSKKWVLAIKGIDVHSGTLELFDQIQGDTTEELLSFMPLAADRFITLASGGKVETFNPHAVTDNTKDLPSKALILYMPMDGNARDLSPSKNNGTAIGVTLATDRFGREKKAYHFKNQIAYIATTQKTTTTGSFTIAAWIKTESSKGGRIAGFGNSREGMSDLRDQQIYMRSSGQISFGILDTKKAPVVLTNAETYNTGEWVFVAGVCYMGALKLYINGELVDSGKRADPLLSQGYWRIGYDIMNTWPGEPVTYTLDGDIDDVRIYSRALDEKEITALYHQNGYSGADK
jgi:hypothetical protein